MGRSRLRAVLGAVGLSLLVPLAAVPLAAGATLTVVNEDGAGEGFNDTTPVAPVGGNTGTTRGAQRLIAFQYAADIWGAILGSGVEIRIAASFDALPCDATSATLGQAGPRAFNRAFAGAPVANTWYPIALANALAGTDTDPGNDDIDAQFNRNFGVSCPFGGWYYGLDGNPGGLTDFVTVVLHELGHGLGFLTLVDIDSGQKAPPTDLDDVFSLDLEDHTPAGELWPDMTNAERVASSIDTSDLHWVGPNVVADGAGLAAGRHASGHVQMFAPDPAQPGSSVSHFDTALSPNEIMEPTYTGANHNPGLAVSLLADLGWTTSPPGPTTTTTSVTTTTSTVTTTTLPDLDDYMCDKAATNPTAGGVKFDKLNLPTRSLEDLVLNETCAFKKENVVCNPAEKNGEGAPANPGIHYLSYLVLCPTRPIPPTLAVVFDQYHPTGLTVQLTKRFNLLVPSSKTDLSPVPPLPPQVVPPLPPDVLDHVLCYKVKTPKFLVPVPVTVTDQFYPGGYPGLTLTKMTKFCMPVNKGNEDPGAQNHAFHYACYQAKLPRGTQFTRTYVSTNNDNFGSQVLKVTNTAELCVPAL